MTCDHPKAGVGLRVLNWIVSKFDESLETAQDGLKVTSHSHHVQRAFEIRWGIVRRLTSPLGGWLRVDML